VSEKTCILRNKGYKIAHLGVLLLLLILRKMVFRRENVYLRRMPKHMRALLDVWRMPWLTQDHISFSLYVSSGSMKQSLAKRTYLPLQWIWEGFHLKEWFPGSLCRENKWSTVIPISLLWWLMELWRTCFLDRLSGVQKIAQGLYVPLKVNILLSPNRLRESFGRGISLTVVVTATRSNSNNWAQLRW
jgi:hypothetical protein